MLSNQPFFLPGDTDHACLLLHGLGGGVYEMQGLGLYLHELGLTVQGILYPGHDQPARRMPQSSWRDWMEHIEAVYQALAQNYPRVSLIGFSTGCPLALYLAAHHPVFKLVMLAPYLQLRSVRYLGWPLETYISTLSWLIRDVPRFRLPTFDTVLEKEARAVAFFRTFNLAAVRSAMELIEQVKPHLANIQNPTLIVQSLRDTVVDPAGAAFLYEELGACEKEQCWLKTSDHILTLDTERDEVFQLIGEFLLKPGLSLSYLPRD
jgi:carboxylesterase